MQVAPVFGNVVQLATVGFDFFEQVVDGVIPIGPTPHAQGFVVALQADFRLIAFRAARSHQRMPCDAFLRRRRGQKAQVKVAMLGRELAQSPNGYKVFQGEVNLAVAQLFNFSFNFRHVPHARQARTCTMHHTAQFKGPGLARRDSFLAPWP